MAIRKIIKYPAPSLHLVCGEVYLRENWFFRGEFLEHLQDLHDTLAATPHGLALASNQIRGYGWRVFVVKSMVDSSLPKELVNPELLTTEWSTTSIASEGCLSIPEISINQSRLDVVKVKYQDVAGRFFVAEYSGRDARIIQHELDHLNGKLLVDYAPKAMKVRVLMEAIRNRKKGL